MVENNPLWKSLLKAERRARSSKLMRLVNQPLLYSALMIFDYIIYPKSRKSIAINVETFFGTRMKTLLPSGTDMRLHTIKAHDSEIRYAKFLVRHLSKGDIYFDVGAHYGYYSLLANVLVGSEGYVYAFEPSASSAEILRENTKDFATIKILQAAVSDTPGEVIFYEYPVPYAECNTTVKDAYVGQSWLKHIQQIENKVPTIVIDDLLEKEQIKKAMFKIDAEGGEAAVVRGMTQSLRALELCVVMEYHYASDKISIHDEAVNVLQACGYGTHGIDNDGRIFPVSDIGAYMKRKGITSDNLVFTKV